jgi:hypothetical protein
LNIYLNVDSTFKVSDDERDKTMVKSENISENIIKNGDTIDGDNPVVDPINKINGNHINHNTIDNIHDNGHKMDMNITGVEMNTIVSTGTYENVNNADKQAMIVTDSTAAVLTEEATDGKC